MARRAYTKVQLMYLKANRNRHYGTQTRINKIRKIRNKVEYHNPNDSWEQAYHRNLIKLTLMVLLYLYSNDDGKVSKKELRKIKIVLKQERKSLNQDDHMEIYNLAIKKLTASAFFAYMIDHEYEAAIFNDACDKAKDYVIKQRKYYKILDDLKVQYGAYIE